MSVTNASGLNNVKTYNNIVLESFLRVMTHALVEQKIDGKHILMYEPMKEQNTFLTFL